MPQALPKNHFNLVNYKAKLLQSQRFQSDSCIIAGNGPSAPFSNIPKDLIKKAIIMRCNWFFLEERPLFGKVVDYYFQSVYNQGLINNLKSADIQLKYDIKRYCMPFLLNEKEVGPDLNPVADHWAILATNSTLARFMMGRPLPTQGMQMIAFAAIMGFKKIYIAGIDMYSSKEKRYHYDLPLEVVNAVKEKDIKAGYEDKHSQETDLKFLETIQNLYDFTLIGLSDKMSTLKPFFANIESNKGGYHFEKSAIRNDHRDDAHAFITLADGMHAFGAVALARSIKKYSDKKLIVLYSTDSTPYICKELDNIILKKVDPIANPHQPKQRRFTYTFTKLRIFEVYNYERLAYLDADCVVMDNIDELFNSEEILVAPDWGNSMLSQDFNSGMIAFSPSRLLKERIFGLIENMPSNDGGDQGFLNEALRNKVTFVHPTFNTLKRLLKTSPTFINLEDVRVLHYVGNKPWDKRRDSLAYASLNRLWYEYLTEKELRLLIEIQKNPNRLKEIALSRKSIRCAVENDFYIEKNNRQLWKLVTRDLDASALEVLEKRSECATEKSQWTGSLYFLKTMSKYLK